jgi:hypothetical protein
MKEKDQEKQAAAPAIEFNQGVIAMEKEHEKSGSTPRWGSSLYSVCLLVVASVAAYILLTRHFAHTLDALPYLVLLACPLMHVFMHHGHHHGHERNDAKPVAAPQAHAPLEQQERP